MFANLDADFIGQIAAIRSGAVEPGAPARPDLSKRGAMRSVFDGRHRFTRYFSPTEHHRPETLDDLTAHNDLELFDLESDPTEATNLAADPNEGSDLILEMNERLNQLIAAEVGVDDGGFLPTGSDIPWEVERWDI